jgi:hypothetical protein
MGSHPINLVIRFLLELSALLALGGWGWQQAEGSLRFVLAVTIPLSAAILWGVFAVPHDPSRSGTAPIAVPGMLRLALELAVFGFATWTLYEVGATGLSWMLGIAVTLHYLASYDRILWLIKQ